MGFYTSSCLAEERISRPSSPQPLKNRIVVSDRISVARAGKSFSQHPDSHRETEPTLTIIVPGQMLGEQWDNDINLYFLRARFMETDRGRFWTMDPFAGITGNPDSLHKYLYAKASPVILSDPSGEMFRLVDLMAAIGLENILKSVKEAGTLHRWRMTMARYCSGVAETLEWSIKPYRELQKMLSGFPGQAHHVFQNASMGVFADYSRGLGLCMPMLGKSTLRLSPHYLATQAQRGLSSSGLAIDTIGWFALVASGCRKSDATTIIDFVREGYTLLGILL